MDYASGSHAVTAITQIVFVDLLLSGDNALLIALVCRNLPAGLRWRALVAGTAAAIVLRTALTTVAGVLMRLPLLEIGGALLLLVIAIKLLLAEPQPGDARDAASSFWGAVVTIVVADLAMSLDNVVAIAGAANGSPAYLGFGLALSIPLLMFGSTFVGRLLHTRPLLVPAGAALLGWIAGRLAVSDPLWSHEIARHAPALRVVVPALCAVFVVVEGRIVAARLGVLGPAPRLRSAAAVAAVAAPIVDAAAPIDASVGGAAPAAVTAVGAGAARDAVAVNDDSIDEARSAAAPSACAADTAQARSDGDAVEPGGAEVDAPTPWQRLERIALKVFVPLVVVAVFALLGWMGLRTLDLARHLPPPRQPAAAAPLGR